MKENIIYILLNLGVGVILVYLSMLFIEKVYIKIKPKEIDERIRVKRGKMFDIIMITLGSLTMIFIQILLFLEGKATWRELLIVNLSGIVFTVSMIFLLSNQRVQKWLSIR